MAQDDQEQYTRREILEFLNIPIQYKENTTELIIHFCRYYLGIHINKYDISTSHRMVIAEEKKKYGSEYIPPIYCKFVNRSIVHLIMQSKHRLKNARNNLDQKFIIRENLTLHRRLLKDRVDKELHSYHFKWVKNGNILVRKNKWSKAVKILSEEVLENLLKTLNNQRLAPSKDRNSRSFKNIRSEKNMRFESNTSAAVTNTRLPLSSAMSQPSYISPVYSSTDRNFSSLSQPLHFDNRTAHSVYVDGVEFV